METDLNGTPATLEKSIRQLKRITSIDNRTEQEKLDGAVCFRNTGILEVFLDTNHFNEILRKQGLTSKQISQLEVVFCMGTSSDRDYHGNIIGGYHNGNKIEIYTTLPVDRGRTYIDSLPIHQQTCVNFLLHEMKHYQQEQNGTPPLGTFMATEKEWSANKFEQEALQFENSHGSQMTDSLEIKENGLFEDNLGERRRTGNLEPYGKFYNLDRRLHTIDTDNPVLYLEQEIDDWIAAGLPVLENESGQKLVELVGKSRQLSDKGQFGIAEHNGLMDHLARLLEKNGHQGIAQGVRASKY